MPQYEDLYTKKTHLTSRLSQLRENSETLKEEVHQRELTILSLRRDINQATREIDEASQRIELFTIEKEEFSAALQQASDETVSLQQERDRVLMLKKEKMRIMKLLEIMKILPHLHPYLI